MVSGSLAAKYLSQNLTPYHDPAQIMAKGKRKATADAVEILGRRYYAGKPRRLAALEQARSNDHVARKLTELRIANGLSQRQLTQLIGTTASVICRLEDANYEGSLPGDAQSNRRGAKSARRDSFCAGRTTLAFRMKTVGWHTANFPGKNSKSKDATLRALNCKRSLSPCHLSGSARSKVTGLSYKHNDRSTEKALSGTSQIKKLKKKISRLAKDATDDEVIRWTKSHDVFDRLEAGVSEIIDDHSDLDAVLHEAIFQDNTAQLNMRLPPAMKAVLSKRARERTTDATTLARIWLAERLERELKAG